eukprot:jgi/Picre1/29135/NNA_004528.t1
MLLDLFDQLMQRIKANDKVHVSFCVSGIIGCLVVYGILQERIMQEPFEGEQFKYSLLLVLCNRLVTVLVAGGMLVAGGQDLAPVAPPQAYAAVSVSNVVATFCQYEALKHVKRYNTKDYGVAALVTLGCSVFIMTGDVTSKHAGSNSSMFGVMLMVGYLAFDGFTSTFQDKLFKGYQMTIFNQIMYVQAFSAGFSTLGLISAGQFGDAISFVMRHPSALGSILTLSAAATIGQLFISHTIKTYGALLFATVMTTRQFISILLSCILFAHPLSMGQWVGTVTVFGALYYKTLSKKVEAPSAESSAKTAPDAEAGEAEKAPLVDNQK